MKRVVLLGSTGSIGASTCKVAQDLLEDIQLVGLAAGRNVSLLREQVEEFSPRAISVMDHEAASELTKEYEGAPKVFCGGDGLIQLATMKEADIVLIAIVGTAGLQPALAAIRAGKDIAVASKEILVMAGETVMSEARKHGVKVLAVDSEHSAIFQCLVGEPKNSLKKIILTGSGGPFLNRPIDSFNTITKEEALNHPNWDMGNKISIDSATMMNKGLEYIEALWLFGIQREQLEIVIHPESIVHSLVQFVDDSYKAQLGIPSMKVPIQYALSYPERLNNNSGNLDFDKMNQLNFSSPDFNRYPCLELTMNLVDKGGNSIPIMSIANDYTVELFLNGSIEFLEIANTIEKTVNKFYSDNEPTIEDLVQLNEEIKLYLGSKL